MHVKEIHIVIAFKMYETCIFRKYYQVSFLDFSLQEFYLCPNSSQIVLGLSRRYLNCGLWIRFLATKWHLSSFSSNCGTFLWIVSPLNLIYLILYLYKSNVASGTLQVSNKCLLNKWVSGWMSPNNKCFHYTSATMYNRGNSRHQCPVCKLRPEYLIALKPQAKGWDALYLNIDFYNSPSPTLTPS